MTTRPNLTTKTDDAKSQAMIASSSESKQEIYPQINDRFKEIVIWLGLAFVLMVFLIQQFSGYS